MNVLTKGQQCLETANFLIEIASKEQLANCARVLALKYAHYEMLYGELPPLENLESTSSTQANEQYIELIANSMEAMASILGNVINVRLEDRVNH